MSVFLVAERSTRCLRGVRSFLFLSQENEVKINPLLKICILKIIIVPKDNIAERKQSSPNIFRDFNRDVICACLEGVETRESKKEEKQTHTQKENSLQEQ